MDNTELNRIIGVIKLSLWNEGKADADRDIYEILEEQKIATLSGSVLSSLSLSDDLEKEWKRNVIGQLLNYDRYVFVQDHIPVSVPYVILKGTAASQYYPHPEYRVMGDIDIITRREDFDIAYQQLLDGGYEVKKKELREIGFVKDGIMVELHRSFSKFNEPEKSEFLDNLIIDNVNESHYLPTLINGLVLIEHINQHLENGLGLRQIIDWMMYVYHHLSDKEWPEFQPLVARIGLERLAIVTTKMCQTYLGLPERKWCADADDETSRELFEYLISCGNFGQNKTLDSKVVTRAYGFSHSLHNVFRIMQRNGLRNWPLAQKWPILRPFAWIYQILFYLKIVLFRRNAIPRLIEEYKEGAQSTRLFEKLGVKQTSKGNVIYSDGTYTKEFK